MSLLGPYPVGDLFSNMSRFRQSHVADGTYFLTIVFISSSIRPKQPFTISYVELKEMNLFCFLSNSPAETLYLVSCYKLCSLSNFPLVCISLQCDDTKQQCPKPSLSAHTFCKVKVKRSEPIRLTLLTLLPCCRRKASASVRPVLDSSALSSDDDDSLYDPSSITSFLTESNLQTSSCWTPHVRHWTLQRRKLEQRGVNFSKEKLGARPEGNMEHIADNKGVSVYVGGQWLCTDVSCSTKFPRWSE